MAKTWINRCLHSETVHFEGFEIEDLSISQESLEEAHDVCREYVTPGYIPTRLLELGDVSSKMWRLCIPSQDDIDVVAYATLSYCWGGVNFLKLKQQLIPKWRAGEHICHLPQVFQDAISITKQLGFRYLWIDALCIIQDSEEDFKREAATMAEVYSNTAVNIVAASCNNPFESLFKPRSFRTFHVARIPPSWNTKDTLPANESTHVATDPRSLDSIIESDWIRQQFDSTSTSCRGWIFQELILPPRKLYFLSSQIWYMCRASEACEIFPKNAPYHLTHSWHINRPLGRPGSGDWAFYEWGELVERYNKCDFTFFKDKAIAFMGIEKVFQKFTGEECVAGMWKSRLPWTLHWQCRTSSGNPPKRSLLDIAPTWSWLSIDGNIDYVESNMFDYHQTILCDVLHISSFVATSLERESSGILTLRAPSFIIYSLAARELDIPYLSAALKWSVAFSPDGTDETSTAGSELIFAILTVDGSCEECLYPGHQNVKGLVSWTVKGLILE